MKMSDLPEVTKHVARLRMLRLAYQAADCQGGSIESSAYLLGEHYNFAEIIGRDKLSALLIPAISVKMESIEAQLGELGVLIDD